MAITLIQFLSLSLSIAVLISACALFALSLTKQATSRMQAHIATLQGRLSDLGACYGSAVDRIDTLNETVSAYESANGSLTTTCTAQAAALLLVRVELGKATALIERMQKNAEHLEQFPLFYVEDEKLANVVYDELATRYGNYVGPRDEAHRLASKVGGKCFRIVDTIKRGKPFNAPSI